MWGVRIEERNSFAHIGYFTASDEEAEDQDRTYPRRHSAPDILEGSASRTARGHSLSHGTIVYGKGYKLDEAPPPEEKEERRQESLPTFEEQRSFPEEDEEDDDGPPMCAMSSMRSTGSSSSSWSASTADTSGSQRSEARKRRPCKQKRMRLKRLVQKLVDQLTLGTGKTELTLPESLIHDRKQFLKVVAEVQEGVRRFQTHMQQYGVVLPFTGGEHWATTLMSRCN